jgi:hypothetical protein
MTATLTDHDIEHRHEFARYATRHSPSDWHKAVLERLYRHWGSINGGHFAGECIEPTLDLKEPKSTKLLGLYATIGGHGQPGEILIRPSLVTGKHKLLREGDEFAEGRMRYVEDVLLHESVHQYCWEVLHDIEPSYKGHGPVFAGECNRIGEALGLAEVRPAKARGPLKELPSCADWPHNVRPRDYYLGAVADPEPKPKPDPDEVEAPADTFPCPLDADKAPPVIEAHFDPGRLVPLGVDIIGRAVRIFMEQGAAPTIPATMADHVGKMVHRAIMRHAVPADGDGPKAKEVPAVSADGDGPKPKAKEPRKGRAVSADGDRPKAKPRAEAAEQGPTVSADGDGLTDIQRRIAAAYQANPSASLRATARLAGCSMRSVQLYRKKFGLDRVPADGDKAKAEVKTKATERAISEILSGTVVRHMAEAKERRRVSTGGDKGARSHKESPRSPRT